MDKTNVRRDAKSEKLLKQVNQLLDELLNARTGTALSVAHPRLRATIDALAQHRYSQIGVSEPEGTGKQVVHTTAEKSNN